jgi:hypothetical protein
MSDDHTQHITIRRVADGVVRVLHWRNCIAWDDPRVANVFWWSKGNASSDGNRRLWFADAASEPRDDDSDDDEEDAGGGDPEYRIVSITQDDDPKILYTEAP